LHITFTPSIAEHLRATGELRRVARVYDAAAALPFFVACLVIGNVISQSASRTGPLRIEEFVWLLMPLMFFVGVGIRVRRGLGGAISVRLGAEGIEVAQPRHRWSVPWSRVARVGETEEFFLVATARAAFYIPKRALEGEGEAERLRGVLGSRGE
jgi:hypothetical protein